MIDHFRAFSFVDRIHEEEAGKHIRGSYHIPEAVGAFPLSLVAESIGQLAAWSSMAAMDFAVRPVAGIAGRVEFPGRVRPGDTLELEATLVKADEEAVAYDGIARVNGIIVVQLHDCLGPMLPLVDFDDPAALRERHHLLTSTGARPDSFAGVPLFAAEKTGGTAGETAEGHFLIPASAPFFGDHFPRRPVFPGTLLMNLNLSFAIDLAVERAGVGTGWTVREMTDVKIRSFMAPGEILDLKATIAEDAGDLVRVLVETRKGKRLTSSARILLSRLP